jgi:hypothetical protein
MDDIPILVLTPQEVVIVDAVQEMSTRFAYQFLDLKGVLVANNTLAAANPDGITVNTDAHGPVKVHFVRRDVDG